MITYSVQHILILRLLIQFPLPTLRELQHMLFLASAYSPEPHEVGFYDYIRTKTGAHSDTVFAIMQDFYYYNLVEDKAMKVTVDGQDIYYALASVLKLFEDYSDRCTYIWNQLEGNLEGLDKLVQNSLVLRKVKPGKRVFGHIEDKFYVE